MTNLKQKLLALDIFDDNEYFDSYLNLVQSNQTTQKQKYLTQKHHIIPRSYFKHNNLKVDNSLENVVNFLYKDHILAHYYLALCSKPIWFKVSNVLAFNFIVGNKKEYIKDIESLFAELNVDRYQELYSESLRARYTSEVRAKMSQQNKGRIHIHSETEETEIKPEDLELYLNTGWKKGRLRKWSDAQRQKFKETRAGHAVTEETKEKIRKKRTLQAPPRLGIKMPDHVKEKLKEVNKNLRWVHNDKNQFKVSLDEVPIYLEQGYKTGKIPNQRTWIIKDTQCKNISIEELDTFIEAGWRQGRIINKKKKLKINSR